MPGNQNPWGLTKPTETKVVIQVAPSRTQCYISKAYKIPQNCGCDSPFFGSILAELIPKLEGAAQFCLNLKYRYSDFLSHIV